MPGASPRTRDSPLEAAQLTWLRDAFADTQATRRPEAYHGGHRLPERLMGALLALRGTQDDERDRVSQMLSDAAVALDAIAENKHNARREAEHALVRVDTAVTALKGPKATAAQRFSKQLQEAAEFRFPDLLQPDVISPLRAASTEVREASDLGVADPASCRAIVGGGRAGDRRRPVRPDRARPLDRADGPVRPPAGDGAHLHPLRRARGRRRGRDHRRVADHHDLAADGCDRRGDDGGVSRRSRTG